MKKPKPAPAHTGKMLAIGTKVAVLRPNLWAGHVGEVVEHDGDNHFHCCATIEELKEIKP